MILDTCALLWLAQGEGELSEAALQRRDVSSLGCAPVLGKLGKAVWNNCVLVTLYCGYLAGKMPTACNIGYTVYL